MTAPVSYPLGAPTLVGNTLTVDTALKQPGRITKRIADLTLQKFIVDRIFASSGDHGRRARHLRPGDDEPALHEPEPERRMPGDEYPIVGAPRTAPQVALSEDWGGKFFVTDEAVRRNDRVYFDNQVTAAGEHDGAGSTPRRSSARGGDRRTRRRGHVRRPQLGGRRHRRLLADERDRLAGGGLRERPARRGRRRARRHLRPVDREPAAEGDAGDVYGAGLADVLASFGIEIFASNRVAAGTPTRSPRGQVGFLDYEQGWPRRRGASRRPSATGSRPRSCRSWASRTRTRSRR
jgi:hypothetical protein